jgi:hypothetical protein
VRGLTALARWLEVLGGSLPLPARLEGRTSVGLARGGWWLVLLLVAWAFAGRATKFIYVDF